MLHFTRARREQPRDLYVVDQIHHPRGRVVLDVVERRLGLKHNENDSQHWISRRARASKRLPRCSARSRLQCISHTRRNCPLISVNYFEYYTANLPSNLSSQNYNQECQAHSSYANDSVSYAAILTYYTSYYERIATLNMSLENLSQPRMWHQTSILRSLCSYRKTDKASFGVIWLSFVCASNAFSASPQFTKSLILQSNCSPGCFTNCLTLHLVDARTDAYNTLKIV